jgi:hypothetical protein
MQTQTETIMERSFKTFFHNNVTIAIGMVNTPNVCDFIASVPFKTHKAL